MGAAHGREVAQRGFFVVGVAVATLFAVVKPPG
jgi:hypothetical protein